MVWLRRTLMLLVVLGFTSRALAEDAPIDPLTEARGTTAMEETHPIYSSDSVWVMSMVVGVIGLFAAAGIIGPIVRAEEPDAVPVAVSHEEDPAVDRHQQQNLQDLSEKAC